MGKTIFVDGNPAQGQVGTLVTAAFLNALQTHRHDGLDKDGSAPSNYGSNSGSVNAISITLSPPLTAHVIGMPISFKAAGANTAACTLNVDGLGAKSIVLYNGTSLPPNTLSSGQIVTVIYDGTNYQMTSIAPQAAISGAFRGLKAYATGGTNAITVAADEIVVGNSLGSQVLTGVSLSINGTSVGVNGLDTGTLAASTWYSLWVIYNPLNKSVAGLMSLSETSPTKPTNYTYGARIGWIRTDSTNKYPLAFVQYGRSVQYRVMGNVAGYPQMASGVQGSMGSSSSTLVAVSVSDFVPASASAVRVSAYASCGTTLGSLAINPNNAVSAGRTSATNQAQVIIGGDGDALMLGWSGDILLESTNIYYANTCSTATLNAIGWEDNL